VIVAFRLLGTHLCRLRSTAADRAGVPLPDGGLFLFDDEDWCASASTSTRHDPAPARRRHDPASSVGVRVTTVLGHPLTMTRALVATRRPDAD